MFDRIDEVVVVTDDIPRACHLYVDHLGFVAGDQIQIADPRVVPMWGAGGAVAVTRLSKPGATGGGIRLVEGPPAHHGRRTMDRPGPFAIDFYARDLHGLYEQLRADGFTFRSEPVRYQLFGTDFAVDEVLLEAQEGTLHALVEFLPGRHRCVLGDRPQERVSEIVAMVTLTDDLAAGRWLLADAFGGDLYFDQEFSGPVIEELIGLPPGSAFRAVIVRGPQRLNARAELMTCVGEPGDALAQPPRVFPSVRVADLDAVVARINAGSHGARADAPVAMPDALGGGRATSVSTPFGFYCELRDQ